MLRFFLLSILISYISADIIESSPYCRKPYNPMSFSSQGEIDLFFDEVQRYKRCIQEFVNEQNNAISTHQNAAQRAIDEWNYFAKSLELLK